MQAGLPTAELLDKTKELAKVQKEKEELNLKYLGALDEIRALKDQLAQVTGDGGGQKAQQPPRERHCAGRTKDGNPCRVVLAAAGRYCHHHTAQAGATAGAGAGAAAAPWFVGLAGLRERREGRDVFSWYFC